MGRLPRAHARGDAAGMRAALAGHDEVMALMPRHRPTDSEDAGGADASVFAAERELVTEARAGRAARYAHAKPPTAPARRGPAASRPEAQGGGEKSDDVAVRRAEADYARRLDGERLCVRVNPDGTPGPSRGRAPTADATGRIAPWTSQPAPREDLSAVLAALGE
jgi:hypothetical protein